MKKFILSAAFMSLSILMLAGCGDSSNKKSTAKTSEPELSAWEKENGFGPVKEKVVLGAIDKKMAAKGEKIFESKCASCHKLDERYVGPAQRNVLERVTPEFFMNMVLNPDENIDKHPHAKQMLAVYLQRMTNQNVNLQDARELLEYFRVLDEGLKAKK
ncbi:MAG: cytochrome c [Bacteroidetes bacterium]|nr:cytochrome c [Bacteroidota bacterium]